MIVLEGEGIVAAGRVWRRTLLQCDLFFGSARLLDTSHSAPSPISLTEMPPTARSPGASYPGALYSTASV